MIDSTVCSNIKMINILEYKWDKSMHERFGQAVLGEEISEYKNYDFNTQMLEFRLVNSITVLEKQNFAVFQLVKDSNIFHSLQLLANSTLGRLLFAELTEQIGCLRKAKDIDGLKKLISSVLQTCNGMFNGKAYDSLSNKDLLKDIVTKESDLLIDVFKDFLTLLSYLEDAVLDVCFPMWEANLFKAKPGITDFGLNFMVSLFRNTTDALNHYHVISASVVSQLRPILFQERKYGYLYCPRKEQIIGMAPSDLSTIAFAGPSFSCSEIKIDPLFNLISALTGDIKLNSSVHLQGNFSDFCKMYDFNDFQRMTYDYNEVILRADTEPIALFTTKDNLSACLNDLNALCTVAKLPLVIWGANKAYTISVKYLPKFFDFMRFLGSSNRR